MAKALGEEYQVLTADNAGDAIEKAFGDPTPGPHPARRRDARRLRLRGVPGAQGRGADRGYPDHVPHQPHEAQAQVEGFQLGAVDYITKPINAGVLQGPRAHCTSRSPTSRLELERLVAASAPRSSRRRAPS